MVLIAGQMSGRDGQSSMVLIFNSLNFGGGDNEMVVIFHGLGKKLTSIPRALATASHQICQIMAKPNTKANMPFSKPKAVFFGKWISRYCFGLL